MVKTRRTVVLEGVSNARAGDEDRRRRRLACGAAVGVLALMVGAGSAMAQPVYLEQSRSVSASLSPGGAVDSSAPGMADWDTTVIADPVPMFGGAASARQVSSLRADGVRFESFLDVSMPSAAGTGVARGMSELRVRFRVDGTATYSLVGRVDAPPMFEDPDFPPYTPPRREVRLSGPGVDVHLHGDWRENGTVPPNGPGDFSRSGQLVAGEYEFLIAGVSVSMDGIFGRNFDIMRGRFFANLLITPVCTSPAIASPPVSQSVCRSGAASFIVSASGTGPLAYQWRKNGTPISAAVNPSAITSRLEFNPVRTSDGGRYDCVVSNACGQSTTPGAELSVCGADFNCDEFLDFFDYDEFVTAFDAGTPRADFNEDGFLDFFDYDDFVGAFESGC